MIKIVYMGTPEFAVAPLAKLLENKYEITGVITVPDKAKGRGLQISKSAVKEFAEQRGIKVLQPLSLKDPDFIKELQELKADLFIVVAFRMLPKIVWDMPRMGTFNLHASLLPMYRGAAPINWAIINGEQKSGVTTFLLDDKIDTGNILLQAECNITKEDTFGSLHDKLMEIGSNLVLETVKGLENNSLKGICQDKIIANNNLSKIPDAPKLTKELCIIDWNKSAQNIEHLIKGLSPHPVATTKISNNNKCFDVKIYMADIENCESADSLKYNFTQDSIRRIVSDNKKYIHVICKNSDILSIKELQLAGKKRMNVKDFLAGFRDIEDYHF